MRQNGQNGEKSLSTVNYQLSIEPDFDDGIFEEAARELLNAGGYSPEMLADNEACRNLIKETFRVLDSGVSKGLGTKPDPELAAALRENVFVFSGFKTHAELEQAAQLITDEKGVLKPFNQFLNDAKTINAEYNHNYLRSEYNQAVQSAQIAAKWHDVQSRKNLVNLQYRTANDERVRAEHRRLHGVTLPVDDPFWKQFTPPLGWNCRCTIVEVLKDDYPESDSQGSIAIGERITEMPKDRIFRFNPGIEKEVFPKRHPYLPKGCGECEFKKDIGLAWQPDRIVCRACVAIRECYQAMEKENARNLRKITVAGKQAIYQKPITDQFTNTFNGKNGGKVLTHELKDKEQMDFERITNAAKLFGDTETVLIMPEIHASEKEIRQRLGLPEKSNPDLKVGNEWVDVKSPFSVEAISDNACAAQKQSAIACITDDMCILKVADLNDYAKKVFRSQGYHQDKVYFVIDGVLYKYNRQDFK